MIFRGMLVLILSVSVANAFYSQSRISASRLRHGISCGQMKMTADNQINDSQRRGMKGYYVRPSRAIEKGGGFFVPGLEDEKLRFFSGSFISILVMFNHISVDAYTPSVIIGEVIAMGMGLFLILQAFLSPEESADIKPDKETLSILYINDKSKNQVNIYEFISREIIKTCQGIGYLLCLTPDEIVLEIGYPTRKSITNISTSVLYSMAESLATTDKISKSISNENIDRVFNDFQDVSVVRGHGDKLWMIASYEPSAVKENLSWIKSLVKLSNFS